MCPPVVRVQNVSKHFRLPHEKHTTIVDHISTFSALGGRHFEEFWALQDVSFELERGGSVALVGPNGSGKSTLLKLLANILRPDKGSITVRGSIAPILELGVGFHRDLTVKENALIYGVIMGLRRSEMKKRIADILDFSGLAEFQDADLKKLSSGMQVRLAFSIAIESDADVFLVDEALAVGDAGFQRKCLDRFQEFEEHGKTLIVVSHDMDLIKSLCEVGVYLHKGRTQFVGGSNEAARLYLEDVTARQQ